MPMTASHNLAYLAKQMQNALLVYSFIFQKKDWLCLNCQTQRLMSGGLDDPPLPYGSPKHQQVGSPRHHILASQQPAPQPTSQKVSTTQQEGSNAISRQQNIPTADRAVPVPATTVKLAGDPKPVSQSSSALTTTKSISEAQRKAVTKLINEPEHVSAITEENKPNYKKGTTEPSVTTTTKDEKRNSQRSRSYEVILYFKALFKNIQKRPHV